MQLHNNHQRLVKRLLPRFSPTWLGGGDPEPTSTAAVGPPAAVTPPPPSPTPTPDPTPTPTPTPTPDPVQTSASQPPPQSEPVQQTSSVQTIPTQTQEVTTISSTAPTTSAAIPTTTSLSSLVVPTTTSTPPARVTTPRASVPQSSAAPGTLTVKSATVRSFTNSNGGIVYSTIFEAPEPTTSSAPTQSNVGPIVGAIAGSLVGVVCLIAFISWIIRMHNKRKDRNNDDFDRQSYLRNSMMIPDEAPGAGRPVIGTQAALALARSNTAVGPRPPTMIERKATYGMYGAQASPSFAPGQVVSFDPGQMGSAPPSAGNGYPSPMAFAAYTPPAEHHQSELTRRPSGATLLTRQPTNGGMYNQGYPQQSPVSYSPDSYHPHHDGYTYPMANERNMVQSVTPFQAQQYAEITRQLEGDSNGHTNDSFHPMSPVDHSPVGYAVSDDAHPIEMPLSNPFEEKPKARVASTAPALPPLGLEDGQLSRTGTPIDPNPQHAHWSYDAKGAQPGTRLSVAGMPTLPPAAHTREEKTVVVGNGEAMPPQHANGKRPVSIVDEDDIYGGM